MHPTVYSHFRELIAELRPTGRVLEVGAIPTPQSLLAIDLLQEHDRVGLNLQGDVQFGGFDIVAGNGNAMTMFADESFDLVLSNATLEHDAFFWKTCSEMRRVLKTGGLAIIGVPGFTLESGVEKLALPAPWEADAWQDWSRCALTFRWHGAPSDYYRFTPQACREVLLEGYRDVVVKSVMIPPRLISYGWKA